MKLISAIVKPFKLDEVREALASIGIQGMTVTDVRGFRTAKGLPSCTVARNMWSIFFRNQNRVAIADELLEQAIEAIGKSASTGKIGDGKIFIVDLEQVIRIRTGETATEAL